MKTVADWLTEQGPLSSLGYTAMRFLLALLTDEESVRAGAVVETPLRWPVFAIRAGCSQETLRTTVDVLARAGVIKINTKEQTILLQLHAPQPADFGPKLVQNPSDVRSPITLSSGGRKSSQSQENNSDRLFAPNRTSLRPKRTEAAERQVMEIEMTMSGPLRAAWTTFLKMSNRGRVKGKTGSTLKLKQISAIMEGVLLYKEPVVLGALAKAVLASDWTVENLVDSMQRMAKQKQPEPGQKGGAEYDL